MPVPLSLPIQTKKESEMITKTDDAKLKSLAESFYNLTGIKVAVYDSSFNQIFSFPQSESPFCTIMNQNEKSCLKCIQSTERLCRKCADTKDVIIEKCHAGLTEVVAPLTDGVSVMGYIMFGQVRNCEDKNKFIEDVLYRCREYGVDRDELISALNKVLPCSDRQIDDAVKIFNAIACYIVYEKIVYPSETTVAFEITDYIKNNLDKDLSVEELCRRFFISRTAMYKLTRTCMPEGIAAFVRKQRIEKAKELLKFTSKSVEEISNSVGYPDAAYFLRIFKSETGISASAYRGLSELSGDGMKIQQYYLRYSSFCND